MRTPFNGGFFTPILVNRDGPDRCKMLVKTITTTAILTVEDGHHKTRQGL